MLPTTKTTFDLPDPLLRKAKTAAADQGRPLRDPVADVCMQTADLSAGLRRSSRSLDWADLFIAATALVHAKIVVTRNIRHFDRIDGLEVENWFPGE